MYFAPQLLIWLSFYLLGNLFSLSVTPHTSKQQVRYVFYPLLVDP